MSNFSDINQQLQELIQQDQYRHLLTFDVAGKYIERAGHRMLNLASNDYLGLASNTDLQQSFLQKIAKEIPFFV